MWKIEESTWSPSVWGQSLQFKRSVGEDKIRPERKLGNFELIKSSCEKSRTVKYDLGRNYERETNSRDLGARDQEMGTASSQCKTGGRD